MAKRRSAAVLLTDETRAAVLTVVRTQPGPVTSRDLGKLLPETARLGPADLVTAIDEHLSAGRLFAWPPKTPKSGPRYWDRDALHLLEAAVRKLLPGLDAPLTAREWGKRLNVSVKVREQDLLPVLEQLCERQELHHFPPVSAKGQPRYWSGDLAAWGRQLVVQTLNQKGPLAGTALAASLKGIPGETAHKIIGQLRDSGTIFEHPPVTKSGKVLFSTRPPLPEPYLREIGQQLARRVKLLQVSGVDRGELRRAVLAIVEAAGIEFGPVRVAGETAAGNPTVDLPALMQRLEPGAGRGALVGARDLRRHVSLTKPQFDDLALQLARAGRVSLHRHDFPASLSPQEREELITDGQGNYYIGLALRVT